MLKKIAVYRPPYTCLYIKMSQSAREETLTNQVTLGFQEDRITLRKYELQILILWLLKLRKKFKN